MKLYDLVSSHEVLYVGMFDSGWIMYCCFVVCWITLYYSEVRCYSYMQNTHADLQGYIHLVSQTFHC